MEDARWFIVHTYSGYENKVADNIMKVARNRDMTEEILDVCIPVEKVTVKKNSTVTESNVKEDDASEEVDGEKSTEKVREIERKIYPSYVMVKMGMSYDDKIGEMKITDRAWYVVRNTRGVTGFVGPDGKPSPLSDEEVYRMGVEKKEVKVDFTVGDTVEIYEGAFKGQCGKVQAIDINEESPDDSTVTVAIFMMGREMDVDLNVDEVELVEE